MDDLLYQYNPWWDGDFPQDVLKKRPGYLKRLEACLERQQIVFLAGLRRVGKTSLMKLIVRELVDRGVDPSRILYVSLDDYLLKDTTIADILDAYRKIHKIPRDEKIHVFFDEVTHLPDYHLQLKNVYDAQNVKIFAASSSSSLLRDDKAALTGRSVMVEIRPLDLEEFLDFKGVVIKGRDRHLLDPYFKEYMQVGGLPENVISPSREYVMELVDNIVQKDIVAYHGLRNSQTVRDFFILLMERSGKQVSFAKTGNILGISPDTARRYLGYFMSTYLIHGIQRWGKTNERLLSPQKIYAGDLGIKYAFHGNRDLGSYLENYIYLCLRAEKRVFYVYENGVEIDFYTEDKVLIESKYYAEMTEKQARLFASYPANKRLLIDSIGKLRLLQDI
ncbi:ATP-binding protein [Desulfoplanes sp. PS50]